MLDTLDECKRQFRAAIKHRVRERREKVHVALEGLLSFDPKSSTAAKDQLGAVDAINNSVHASLDDNGFYVDRNRLPRVLLLGPSGVGKILPGGLRLVRMSAGGGLSSGFRYLSTWIKSRISNTTCSDTRWGLSRMRGLRAVRGSSSSEWGGVFFDEIGDASPAIQSKLLAYLDNYRVSPRGWEGNPVACPMLVVAATNRPIEKWADEDDGSDSSVNRFRNDLFRRFNSIVHVPPLNSRKHDLPYILDALLQMEAFNPNGEVSEIGECALSAIAAIDYEKGNFRTLENVLRAACRTARLDGRRFLVKEDVEIAIAT